MKQHTYEVLANGAAVFRSKPHRELSDCIMNMIADMVNGIDAGQPEFKRVTDTHYENGAYVFTATQETK